MTLRLLLLSALALSACAAPETADLGATNLTSLRVSSVQFRVDGETVGTIGPLEPGTATIWQTAEVPDGAAVEAHVTLRNEREVTLPVKTLGAPDAPWIHVRVLSGGLEVETSGAPPSVTPLDPPYGRPLGSVVEDTTYTEILPDTAATAPAL